MEALLLATLGLAVSASGETARGLDFFLWAPDEVAPGEAVTIEVRAIGFPDALTTRPLAGAEAIAQLGPRGLGEDREAARARTDELGFARLVVPVPSGPPGELELWIEVAKDGRRRTERRSLRRGIGVELALHVGEDDVVPGSRVPVWITAHARDGRPLIGEALSVELSEGGFARRTLSLTTDASGLATGEVPIPSELPETPSFALTARLLDPRFGGARAGRSLAARDETPGRPTLAAACLGAAGPGERARYLITAWDSAGRPVPGVEIHHLSGTRRAIPGDRAERRARMSAGTTDDDGRLSASGVVPAILGPEGEGLVLVAEAELNGHALSAEAVCPVRAIAPTIELVAEAGALVPGLRQRLFVAVRSGDGQLLARRLTLTGDGLAASVTTAPHGPVSVDWAVPAEIGARHPGGDCAGGVAATVAVRGDGIDQGPCLPVDRARELILELDPPVSRAGQAVSVKVRGGRDRPFLLVAAPSRRTPFALAVLAQAERGDRVVLPEDLAGPTELVAYAADGRGAQRSARATAIVVPPRMPVLALRAVAGRRAPGGEVELELTLSDEAGAPADGWATLAVTELGAGSAFDLERLDRWHQVGGGLFPSEGLRAHLGADPALDGARRAALAGRHGEAGEATRDPARHAEEALEATVATVVTQLEGAVFEASGDAARMIDVRRKGPRGAAFNPELLSLVGGGMDEPPLTPGGEPLELADLLRLDPQIDFDHVAARVTRLRLFRVLAAGRELLFSERLGPDERLAKSPTRLLERLVADGQIAAELLVDPWGGALAFRPSRRPKIPFLDLVPGHRLTSAGPDGRFGTADDLDDPFARVLRAGSWYARVAREDELVAAIDDMIVGDPTVERWREVFERATGTEFGGALGAAGVGMGGGGTMGYGSGSGRASGGTTRVTAALATGGGRMSLPVPVRGGRARLFARLGPHESTYRVHVLAHARGLGPVTAHLDVPVELPLSVSLDAGARWIAGDRLMVPVVVRSRLGAEARVSLVVTASGAIASPGADTELVIPARSIATIAVPAEAMRPGIATLVAEVRTGTVVDRVSHAVGVGRDGVVEARAVTAVIDGEGTLALRADPRPPVGPAVLTLRPLGGATARAALAALHPDRLGTRAELGLALAAAARALAGPEDLQALAREVGGLARARLAMRGELDPLTSARLAEHGAHFGGAPAGARTECPPEGAEAGWLELEPEPIAGSVSACWDELASRLANDAVLARSPVDLARALLALHGRPHRAALADMVRGALATFVREDGERLRLPAEVAARRADRATIRAALALTPGGALARLAAEQDHDGSFGGAEATRAALSAWLAAEVPSATPRVTVHARRPLELEPRAETRVTLDAGHTRIRLTSDRPIVAHLVDRRERSFDAPPRPGSLSVAVSHPAQTIAGQKVVLAFRVRQPLPRAVEVALTLPLPAGFELFEATPGATVRRGVLELRRSVGAGPVGATWLLPLRARLAGRVRVPEAEVRVVDEPIGRARSTASRIAVAPRATLSPAAPHR